jgi:hypothetical protein
MGACPDQLDNRMVDHLKNFGSEVKGSNLVSESTLRPQLFPQQVDPPAWDKDDVDSNRASASSSPLRSAPRTTMHSGRCLCSWGPGGSLLSCGSTRVDLVSRRQLAMAGAHEWQV